MGNENNSTKYLVLEFLRKQKEPVSGEKLAEAIGISRVSVWKAIQYLCENGYEIESCRKGYILSKDKNDSLDSWEFGDKESFIDHYSVTESTMNEAWELANSGKLKVGEMRVITADFQTNGKGRGDHNWETASGSLAFTLVCQERFPVSLYEKWILCAQISMAETLRRISGREFFVSGPNDVYSSIGKVCGILEEFKASGGYCEFINLGIGVNISSKPDIEKADCVFSDRERPEEATRKKILETFLNLFDENKKMIFQNDGRQ